MKKTVHTLSKLSLAVACATIFSTAQGAVLEEVVVTAQKRVESLQDVPISITALSGEKIDQAGLNNLEDLAAYVPNLMLSENAVTTSIIMRGIGPGANQSFEQSVGLYVDGIHLAKGRQARSGFFDLERVEVLRGPQGILFGKNTLAGAVNVTTATPKIGDEFSGKIGVGFESFGGQSIEGHLNGSVTDNLALRLAVRDRKNDGYLDNAITGDTGPTTDETIGRFSLTWSPTDSTKVEFKHSESDFVREGGTAVIRSITPAANLVPSNALAFGIVEGFYPSVAANVASGKRNLNRDGVAVGGHALSRSLGKSVSGSERKEGTDTQNSDTSLNIDVEFGDGYTFTSVTGRSEYEYVDGVDADFLPISFVGRSDDSEYEQTSQEFRIASDPSKRFSFITGAYIEEQRQEIDRLIVFDGTFGLPAPVMTSLIGAPTLLRIPNATAAALGLPAGVNGLTSFNQIGRVSNWVQETDSWAVFFQGEYQITDNLTLTAGVRYTEEDKTAEKQLRLTTDATGLATPNPSPLLAAVMLGIARNTYAHNYSDERSTSQTTPGVSLEWSQSDDNLYYASYSEGFKSGGFNAVDDQVPNLAAGRRAVYTQPGPGWAYDDETAKSLEIGGKHTLLDGSMTMNWALFTSEYDNQQVSTFVGTGFEVRNAASSEVSGLELDVKWQATDNMQVGANVAYLDAKYGKFDTAGCTADQFGDIRGGATVSGACSVRIIDGVPVANQDLSGKQLAHAPEYSGSIFMAYDRQINDTVNWFAGVDLVITDEYLLTGDLDPVDSQEAFQMINVQTGFRTDSWELMFYGKNVTDEEIFAGGFDTPLLGGSHSGYTDPGAIYGARFSYKF